MENAIWKVFDTFCCEINSCSNTKARDTITNPQFNSQALRILDPNTEEEGTEIWGEILDNGGLRNFHSTQNIIHVIK
jgi:hypothetical protein